MVIAYRLRNGYGSVNRLSLLITLIWFKTLTRAAQSIRSRLRYSIGIPIKRLWQCNKKLPTCSKDCDQRIHAGRHMRRLHRSQLTAMLYPRSCSRLHICFDVLVSGFSIGGNTKLMTYTGIEQRVAGLEDQDSNSKSLLIGGSTNCIAQCKKF
jgi:hypothetical protein